ncbi:hypothetical protein PV327_006734 [Microctonus hyperodae]|uniref:Tether containing UBX domain for GLUT4 n=1 Tax=Microctonus hyperodae TaxID=165561 RepID=A0AA39F510_MICHY|nr:hypothetical protein PV327_006734 [Microctonus hyperodae]
MVMAANKSVTVLAPNGRRQTVKITPNTTILQILEEVCQKHGYSPQKWDIKHFNQILDASSIIRFTGLPNNAQLEMAPRSNERETSNVTIGLQLENGERLMGDFVPTTTLSEIIIQLCPSQEADNTVVIYMHQEVHGKEKLNSTTLQSLGLNNGRAMLRLIHRDLDKLNTQAHVSGQLNSKANKSTDTLGKNLSKAGATISTQIKKALDPLASLRAEKNNGGNKNDKGKMQKKPSGQGHVLGRGESKSSVQTNIPPTKIQPISKNENSMEIAADHDKSAVEQIEFLGERNALIFNQAGAKAIPREDLPDNFFELTVDDAKALLRDAKRQREELIESPLITNAQRELDRNKSTLNKLHKYRRTIIRIQFPNQMVLQGIFGPLETVQVLKDFVREYLADPQEDFVLYCSPPRKDLISENRLIDENLVPTAIVYYSGASDLKADLQLKLVDPKIAGVQAIKSRMTMTRSDVASSSDSNANLEIANPVSVDVNETLSCDPTPSGSITNEASGGLNANRMKSYAPKWFKNAFK